MSYFRLNVWKTWRRRRTPCGLDWRSWTGVGSGTSSGSRRTGPGGTARAEVDRAATRMKQRRYGTLRIHHEIEKHWPSPWKNSFCGSQDSLLDRRALASIGGQKENFVGCNEFQLQWKVSESDSKMFITDSLKIFDSPQARSCLLRSQIQRVNGSLGSVMSEPNVCRSPCVFDAVVDTDLRWHNTVLTQVKKRP